MKMSGDYTTVQHRSECCTITLDPCQMTVLFLCYKTCMPRVLRVNLFKQSHPSDSLLSGHLAVTWRLPLVEQVRFIILRHLSLPPVFIVVCVLLNCQFSVFCWPFLSFRLLLLVIVLSVILLFTALITPLIYSNFS